MLIGIGKGGSAWGSDSQMLQFTLTASQTTGNFPEGMGSAQLTEVHSDKLAPASESLGMSFSFCFPHGLLKVDSRKQLLELAEYATKFTHRWPSFCDGIFWRKSLYHKIF